MTIILLCGLPGTLKTLLATRLAARLGFAYLPTRAAGPLSQHLDVATLDADRRRRYRRVADMVAFLSRAGADLVVDGGYSDRDTRMGVLEAVSVHERIVVYCHCASVETRRRRLAQRSCEFHDHEAVSAQAILAQGSLDSAFADPPLSDLRSGIVQAVLDVDTESGKVSWAGEPLGVLGDLLPAAIGTILAEHQSRTISTHFENSVCGHFDELAYEYDQSTSWRHDPVLLDHLKRDLDRMPARILDMGTGTGLATEAYARQGHHVVGLDLSPKMLLRAAQRLTVTVLGSAVACPFISEYFDLVVGRQCLHYVSPSCLIAEAHRVLRPGGWFVVSGIVVPDERSRRFWLEFKAATQPLRLDVFTPQRLCALLEQGRFEVQQCLQHYIQRVDEIRRFQRCGSSPAGGWERFCANMVRLAEVESSASALALRDGLLSHRQHWATIWARRGGT